MWCITKAKPPKMQGSYCFSAKLLVLSSVLWGNSNLIYLRVCCEVSDCCPILLIPSWLWPPKKNERGGEATERCRQRRKRQDLDLLNEKYMFIIFITCQESTINYEVSFAIMETVVGQFDYWPTVSLCVPLLKQNPFLRKHLFGLYSSNIFKTCVYNAILWSTEFNFLLMKIFKKLLKMKYTVLDKKLHWKSLSIP